MLLHQEGLDTVGFASEGFGAASPAAASASTDVAFGAAYAVIAFAIAETTFVVVACAAIASSSSAFVAYVVAFDTARSAYVAAAATFADVACVDVAAAAFVNDSATAFADAFVDAVAASYVAASAVADSATTTYSAQNANHHSAFLHLRWQHQHQRKE
jgi:hypothetical protein